MAARHDLARQFGMPACGFPDLVRRDPHAMPVPQIGKAQDPFTAAICEPRGRGEVDLDAGRLVRVLPAFAAPAAPLHAIYPGGRHVPLRVRAFVDFLREQLRASWRRSA